MALWEITTGRDEPCLYVKLNGEHEATFDQSMRWWVIEANPHDALALYRSPGRDLGRREKGDIVAEGVVQDAEVDPAILRLFDSSSDEPKVLCTMGSSGTKEHFLEAVRALTSGIGKNWNSLILASPAICSLEEAKAYAGAGSNSYITDAFVPALSVNEMADVVVSHGGQGTVQTALACGTPIVGVAMQLEQQVNLDNVAAKGAGIRIPVRRWTASTIQQTVRTVLEDGKCRENARRLQQSVRGVDGKRNSAEAIWQFVINRLNLAPL